MMSNPERVMCNAANPSFLTTFKRRGQRVLESIDTLEKAWRSKGEVLQSITEHTTKTASNFLPQFLNHPHPGALINEVAQVDERRIYALKMDKPFFESCGRRVFGHIPDCLWFHERGTEKRILSHCGNSRNRLITRRGIGRHARLIHRKMGSVLLFHERVHWRGTKIYTPRTFRCKVHRVKRRRMIRQNWRNQKGAEVPFPITLLTPSSSKASFELWKRLHEK